MLALSTVLHLRHWIIVRGHERQDEKDVPTSAAADDDDACVV